MDWIIFGNGFDLPLRANRWQNGRNQRFLSEVVHEGRRDYEHPKALCTKAWRDLWQFRGVTRRPGGFSYLSKKLLHEAWQDLSMSQGVARRPCGMSQGAARASRRTVETSDRLNALNECHGGTSGRLKTKHGSSASLQTTPRRCTKAGRDLWPS